MTYPGCSYEAYDFDCAREERRRRLAGEDIVKCPVCEEDCSEDELSTNEEYTNERECDQCSNSRTASKAHRRAAAILEPMRRV